MYISYIWLIVLVICLILEASTAGLTTIWFAGGALAAYLTTLAKAGPVIQIMAFMLVSLVLLVFTRPLALKYINNKAPKTNVDSVIGRVASVTEEISNLNASGQILVDGMPWMARAEKEDMVIPAGTRVVIRSVSGVKCIVTPSEE